MYIKKVINTGKNKFENVLFIQIYCVLKKKTLTVHFKDMRKVLYYVDFLFTSNLWFTAFIKVHGMQQGKSQVGIRDEHANTYAHAQHTYPFSDLRCKMPSQLPPVLSRLTSWHTSSHSESVLAVLKGWKILVIRWQMIFLYHSTLRA